MGASESTGRSNGTESGEEEQRRRQQEAGGSFKEKAATAVTVAAGVAVAAWTISRILSDNTDSQEKDDDMAIKAPNPRIREPIGYKSENQSSIRDRFKINTEGRSSGYGGINQDDGGYKYIGSVVTKQPSIWSPPPRGRFKMNTDGACQPNGPGGQGTYGGILRNYHGKVERGFYGFIGPTNDALKAELRGILQGLKLLDRLGYMGAILETDCQAAYQWVTEKKGGPGKKKVIFDCWDTITECRRLIEVNNIDIIKIGEDANKCADKLAAMALKKKEKYIEYVEFQYVLDDIKDIVDKDRKPHGFPLLQ